MLRRSCTCGMRHHALLHKGLRHNELRHKGLLHKGLLHKGLLHKGLLHASTGTWAGREEEAWTALEEEAQWTGL